MKIDWKSIKLDKKYFVIFFIITSVGNYITDKLNLTHNIIGAIFISII